MLVSYDKLSDEDLAKVYFDTRDPKVATFLYKKYLPAVYGIALKYCRNKHNAEDIAMSVFEKLLAMKGSPIVNFKSWLCMIARNASLEFLNKEGKKSSKETSIENSASHFMENEQENHLINEDREESERILTLLEDKMTDLKEGQRICIEMFYYKKMSYQDISGELKMDIKKVKSNIQNGKRKLKILMENKHHRNE